MKCPTVGNTTGEPLRRRALLQKSLGLYNILALNRTALEDY